MSDANDTMDTQAAAGTSDDAAGVEMLHEAALIRRAFEEAPALRTELGDEIPHGADDWTRARWALARAQAAGPREPLARARSVREVWHRGGTAEELCTLLLALCNASAIAARLVRLGPDDGAPGEWAVMVWAGPPGGVVAWLWAVPWAAGAAIGTRPGLSLS